MPHPRVEVLRRTLDFAIPRRLLVAAGIGVTLAALGGAIAFAVLRDGRPVQLVADLSDEAGNVLLNNTRPVTLPVRLLDRRGHTLDPHQVRYRWIAGTSMDVSSDGVLKCEARGDAVVRATIDTLTKDLAIRCRPIEKLHSATWLDLIAGGESRELSFEGVGVDGRPVEYLRAKIGIRDSTVATLSGLYVRPLTVGQTTVNIVAGDKKTGIRILVNELVDSFEDLRADQLFVARRVRLAQGDTVHFSLPRGDFWLKYVPARVGDAPPTITLEGRAHCQSANPLQTVVVTDDVVATLCAIGGPAAVQLAHGKLGAPFVEGFVVLDRMRSTFAKPAKR